MQIRSNESLANECLTKASLNLYNDCFVKRGAQNYLVDDDFQRARLKLQARVNILPLKDTLKVTVCNQGVTIFKCIFYYVYKS